MKRLISLLISLGFALLLNAQVTKTASVTAGGLATALTATELNTVTNLTLTGTIDARDFKTMRDLMPVLAKIDLSGATISAYTGNEGTGGLSSLVYSANTIPINAFYYEITIQGKTSLSSIILPNSTNSIGDSAFRGCNGLTAFDIPSTVVSIERASLSNCTKLSSITIPASVTSIGNVAFFGSSGIITADGKNPNYSSLDGILFNKSKTRLIQCPISKLGSYVIPSSVVIIEDNSFVDCNKLNSITIPSSVVTIGGYAFNRCTGLTSLIIPSSIKTVGSYAFMNCSELTSITALGIIPINLNTSSKVFSGVNYTTCKLYVPNQSLALYKTENQWKDFTNIIGMEEFILSANNANIAVTGGNTTVNITTGLPWSANSDQTWLTVSTLAGIGNQTLTFTAEANPSVSARIATVTVSTQNATAQTIIITQSGVQVTIPVVAGTLSTKLTDLELQTISNLLLTGTIDARDFKTMRDKMPLLSEVDLSGTTISFYTGTAGTSTYSTYYPENTVPAYGFYVSASFNGKTSLTTIILPSSVKSIDPMAFNSCINLKYINFPLSLTYIGDQAFSSCSRLPDTNISSSVTFISGTAFRYCNSLINVDKGNNTYSSIDGILFNKDQTSLIHCPISKNESYSIPLSVTLILESAFEGCRSLTSVNIPSSVKSIESSAFWNCAALTSLNIPSSVTSIKRYAFANCFNLGSVTVRWETPLDLTTSPGVFQSLNYETCSLYVPYGTKSLYAAANQWKDFKNIVEMAEFKLSSTSANIPSAGGTATADLTTALAWSASSDQTWLTVSSATGTGNNTFTFTATANASESNRIATVTVSATDVPLQTIIITQAGTSKTLAITAGGLATALTVDELNSITKFTLTGTIDARDFKTMRDNMPLLAEIDLSGATVEAYSGTEGTSVVGSTNYPSNTVPEFAFENANWKGKISLKSIIFPKSIIAIDMQAFTNCSGLISVSIPSLVTNIGNSAFATCNSLNSVNIPSSVTSIGDGAFTGCPGLINVDSDNPNYSSVDGILFNKTQTELIKFPTLFSGVYTIPSTVKNIGRYSFWSCRYLTAITFQASVVSINHAAFAGCTSLTEVIIPSSVTTLERYAFQNCSSLISAIIPSAITIMGGNIFQGCTNLNSIKNYSLTPVDLSSVNDVFSGVNKTTCKLYVPFDSKPLYAAANQWQDFTNIIEMPEFKLSATSANIPAAGGTASSDLITALAWTASSDQTWLTVSAASGTGNKPFTFTATANESFEQRIAYVTIASSGLPSQTVVVTQAGAVKTLAITAGGLATALTATELSTLTKLKLTGTIDARDFKTMRDNMPLLAEIDLSGVSIAAYSGTGGTSTSASASYPANAVPANAFMNSNWIGKTSLTTLVLPQSITLIDQNAFRSCSNLTSINTPYSLISISYEAFENCTKLASFIITERVTTISSYAFWNCSVISTFNIPSTVTTIGTCAFGDCPGLINVVANNPNYSSVDGVLFNKDQSSLLSCPISKTGNYVIQSSVRSVGPYAFIYCYRLTSVTIPDQLSSIGNYGFGYCSALASVAIPASVLTIGNSAFVACAGPFMADAANPNYSSNNGVLFNKLQTTLIQFPMSKTGTYLIPSSVNSIGTTAFEFCRELTSVTIPSSVTSIGSSAFFSCVKLNEINVNLSIPVNLTSANGVFSNIDKTTCKLNVPYGAKTLYAVADKWKDFTNIVEMAEFKLSSTSANLPAAGGTATVDLTTALAWTASSDQTWLTVSAASGTGNKTFTFTATANESFEQRIAYVNIVSSDLPSQTFVVTQAGVIKTLAVTAGGLATTLTATELSTLTKLKLTGTIDARDFKTMRDLMPVLAEIDLSNVTVVAYSGTGGTSTSASANYSANAVPAYAFLDSNWIGKTSLTSIVLPQSITTIEQYAFLYCYGLTSINAPSSLISIGYGAFQNCTNLSSFIFPEGVTTISLNAFWGCSVIPTFNIPSTVSAIGKSAFGYCPGLINVVANNPNYSSVDGVLFNKDQSSLLSCPISKTGNYVIQSSVRTIGPNAFGNCYRLTSVTIPDQLSSIGEGAFGYCSALASVAIPASVLTIGNSAFVACAGPFMVDVANPNYSSNDGVLFNKLQTNLIQFPTSKSGTYLIPSSVSSIGSGAFQSCSGMTSITIPTSVTSIGSDAFQSCSGLTSVTIPSSVTSIGNYAFSSCVKLSEINVNLSIPVNLTSAYGVFSSINKTTCKLNVPYGAKTLYAAANQWKDFTNIIEAATGFVLNTTFVNLNADGLSTSTINVTSNVVWSVSSNQTWLTVIPVSGSNNGTFTITASENTGTFRIATVTVGSSGLSDQIIVVKQVSGLPPLVLGNNMNGNSPPVDQTSTLINTNNIWEYFRFSPTVTGTYTFNSESGSDPNGKLYDGSGNYLTGNDNSNGLNFNFNYNLIAGQVYYFGLYNYKGNNNLVTVNITGGGLQSFLWINPVKTNIAAATGSIVTVDLTAAGMWTVSSNQAWLTISPTSGTGNKKLTLTATANASTTAIREAIVTASAPNNPDATVVVTQQVTLDPALLDAFEPDNTIAQTCVITSGLVQQHSIYPFGDIDYASFELATAPAQITIKLNTLLSGTQLQLFDVDGTSLLYSSSTSISTTLSKTGKYYIKAWNTNNLIMTGYQLSLDVKPILVDRYEPDNTWTDARVILPFTEQDDHTLKAIGDADYVKFTISDAPRTVYFDVADTRKVCTSFGVWLYGTDGVTQLNYSSSGGNNCGARLQQAIVTNGTYYLKVALPQGNSGSMREYYTIRMTTNGIAPTIKCIPTDSLALVAIYNAAGGANWGRKQGWLTDRVQNWQGVTLSPEGNVTKLNLTGNNLSGTIPIEIGQLTALRFLNLGNNVYRDSYYSSNSFNGKTLPASLANLVNLEVLSLDAMSFGTELPDVFAGMVNLRELYLDQNYFTNAQFPSGILSCGKLERLNISYNNFSQLPVVAGLTNLFYFSSAYNKFTFEDLEPNWMMTGFYYSPQRKVGQPLALNPVVGSLVTHTIEVGGANNLYQWYKNDQPIAGQVTNTLKIENVAKADAGIYHLRISNSLATGTTIYSEPLTLYQKELPIYVALEAFYNSTGGANWNNKTNWLTDAPLSTWYGITQYETGQYSLSINSNNLIGQLPLTMGDLTLFSSIYIGGNSQLTGSIPESIGNLAQLQTLSLSYNSLTGIIPSTIGNLKKLSTLELTNNQLSGSVPATLASCTMLWYIYLYNNNLEDMPNLSAMNLYGLYVYNNLFQFDDLMPTRSGLPNLNFSYSPQKKFGKVEIYNKQAGEALTLTATVGGTGNLYQWYKDGVLMTGKTANTLVFAALAITDRGSYTCKVTNPGMPTLTLESEPMSVVDPTLLDAFEIDNTIAQASTINSGAVQQHSIYPIGDNDYASFVIANAPAQVTIKLAVTISGIQFQLLSGDGIAVLKTASTGLTTNITQNGKYYIKVWNTNNVLVPGYQLSLDVKPIVGDRYEPDNTWTDAKVIMPFTEQDDHTLKAVGDVDYVKFTISDAPRTVYFDVADTRKVCTSFGVWLYGPDGVTQMNYSSIGGNNCGARLEQAIATNGTYFLKVALPQGVSGSMREYYTIRMTTNWMAPTIKCNSTDSLALVAIYNATGGTNWGRKQGWLTDRVENWQGVTLSPEGRVTKLNLTANNLIGTFPTEIGQLTALRFLNLGNNIYSDSYYNSNSFNGKTLPASLANLVNLEVLSLDALSFGTELPDVFASMVNLRELYLDNNSFTNSQFPSGIMSCVKLERLNISYNNFSQLPVVTGLTNLSYFSSAYNKFTFEDLEPNWMMTGFGYSPQRKVGQPLALNPEVGSLVTHTIEVGGANNLYLWYKNDQPIAGQVTNTLSISNVSKTDAGIYHLRISNTLATQTTIYSEPLTLYQKELPIYVALEAFYNSTGGANWNNKTNWLTDAPLSTWYGITQMETGQYSLRINSNNLTGQLPVTMGDLTLFASIIIGGNSQLTGSIPESIGNLAQLQTMSLSYNSLTGTIPSTIGNLKKLSSLELTYNQLSGSVPANLASCAMLRYIYLYNNNLEDMPNLSAMNLYNLYVYSNLFQFDDLMPTFTGKPNLNFSYSPQKKFGKVEIYNKQAGEALTLTATVGGAGNLYQWYKDGVLITGKTANTLVFSVLVIADRGSYTCKVTNPGMPTLTLESEPMSIVYPENQAPVANAGIDQSVNELVLVTLDGSASSDADGNALTYKWTAPQGTTLSSDTASKPTFVAPEVNKDTAYTFSLVVNDGFVDSSADTVVVTVKNLSSVQEIPLIAGWNIISANVIPANVNLKDIFQSHINSGNLKKVMDEAGKTVENFGMFGGWKNNIGNLTATEGYKVNMGAATTLSLEGTPVPLPLDIPLSAGWNIISYPCTTLQDGKALVQSLIDAGKIIKVMDESGKTIENFGMFGGWKNNIGNFTPGKGYKVNAASSCVLTVSANTTKAAAYVPEVLASVHFTKVFDGNGTDHMNISLVDLQTSGLRAGDEIGVFDGKYCVGSATIGIEQLKSGSISIPASANEGSGSTVNGFTTGNAVGLQLYRGNQSYTLETESLSGARSFEKNASVFIKVSANGLPVVQTDNGPDQFRCYPNPFKDELTIEIRTSEETGIDVAIYNLLGQKIKNLYKGSNKGELMLKWNGTNDSRNKVVPGVYLCKMNGQAIKVVYKY